MFLLVGQRFFFNPFIVSPLLGGEQLWVHLQQVLDQNHQILLRRHGALLVSLVKVLDVGQIQSPSFADMILDSGSVHHAGREGATDHTQTWLCIDLLVQTVEGHLREQS